MGRSYTSSQFAEGLVQRSFETWIKRQEEDVRLENYQFFQGYYHGDHVDVLPARIKKAYKDPLMTVICNYCAVVIDTVVDYLTGGDPGISIDVSERGRVTDLSNYCEEYLYSVYENSGLLGTEFITLVHEMCVKGDSFLQGILEYDQGGRPAGISALVKRPGLIFPKYRDDNYKVADYVVNKYYTIDNEDRRHWEAQVFRRDRVDVYDLGETEEIHQVVRENEQTRQITISRTDRDSVERGLMHEFKLIGSTKNLFGMIPMFHLKNNAGTFPFGVSDLQPITPMQDLLNKTFVDLAATMDYAAFQRLFIFGGSGNQEYDVGPGIVTDVPDATGRLHVVNPAPIADFLYTIDTAIQRIATISKTPPEVFDDMSMPTSGYALEIRYMPLEHKAKKKREVLRDTLKKFNRMVLRTAAYYGMLNFGEGVTPDEQVEMVSQLTTKIHFPGGLPRDKIMEAQMHEAYLRMGVKSRETIMEEIGTDNVPEEKNRIAIYDLAQAIVNMMEELEVDDVAGELDKIAAQYGDRVAAQDNKEE